MSLVCIKRVPDVASSVSLTEDAQGIDARHVGYTISNHENCAVELAVQIAAATGGSATVLTVGPDESVEQLRSALGVGCTGAVHVTADLEGFGPADIAREIAEVAGGRSSHDLVLLGNDAADTGDFQVGIRLAHLLERPVVNGVATVEVADGVVTARGEGPEGEQTFQDAAARGRDRARGWRGAALSHDQRTDEGQEGRDRACGSRCTSRGAPAGSRLVLPPAQPSTVEVLGKGPEAADAVVELFARMGVAR